MKSSKLALTMVTTAVLATACGGGDGSSGSGGGGAPAATSSSSPETLSTETPSAEKLMAIPSFSAAEPKLSREPLNNIVTGELLPIIDRLFDLVRAQGLDTELQGVKVFAPNSGDRFLPGKVAIGFSYLLLNSSPSDPKYQTYVDGYRAIADMTINVTNETWGIYYYTSALWKLKKAGYLDGPNPVINPATLATLQTKLDWRTFVDPANNYALLNNLPTNYYGVAFSIARLRYLLGWEDATASEALLQKVINHYKTFSAFGFSDETDGSGRFDRYSILLIGEIMQRLIETDMQVSPQDEAQLKGWLRKSVDVIKLNLNTAGNGVDFGRSLSAYADTAFCEVLSAAERMNVLSDEEKDIAYAFATRATAKYVEFWYDSEWGSLNMWEKGRRTDGYRGKARILGENLSLAHQLIYTHDHWKKAGFATKKPMPTIQYVAYLLQQPATTLTQFAGFDGQPATYDRGMVTYRDGLRVFNLPVVNGAATYHRTNPYFAIPHSYNMISGVADTQWPQLQPKFTFANAGTPEVLIPASYQKNLQTQSWLGGRLLQVSWQQDALDRVAGTGSGGQPFKDTRITSSTRYTFQPGQITRVDTYTPNGPQSISKVEMEFGSFSQGATATGGNRFRFASGDVTGFEVEGLQECARVDVSADVNYNTPGGALKTSIRCSSPAFSFEQPLTIKWVLKYAWPSVPSYAPR